MNKFIIGTNGFNYSNSNRKGLDLWTRLVNDPDLKDQFDFKASGRGWGSMTKAYSFEDLHTFYHSIDIYVSTSSIEGIGYGVLEALASGVPVVIPHGVGVYDELPNVRGVYRYTNYKSLIFEIENCLHDLEDRVIDKQIIRQTTEQYNLDNYVNSHISAFEDLLYDSSKSQKKGDSSDLESKQGIYYVAYGEQARNCFIKALTSVRKYLNDIPVCLVSDTPVNIDLDYQFIEYPDNDLGARNNKTMIYELAPKDWQYVLYLDADTEIISSDVLFLFDILKDGFDCFFCINPTQYILVSDMSRPDNQDEIVELIDLLGTGNLLQLNGGVFGFRRSQTTEQLFNNWNTEWNRYGKRDQAALDRVLYANPVKLYTLGVEWNTVTRYYEPDRSAGILHHPLTARRWSGRIDGRLDNNEQWATLHPDRKQK